MINIGHLQNSRIPLMVVTFKGRLTTEEYAHFLSQFESETCQYVDVPVLFDLREFDGWQADSPWRKLSFDFKYRTNLSRIAIVGSIKRSNLIRKACRPLSHLKVKRFRSRDIELAYSWSADCLLNNLRTRHRDLGF